MQQQNDKKENALQRNQRLNSIKTLLNNKKYRKAKSEMIKYIEAYPYDYFGQFMYAKILIKEKNYEEAKFYLKNIANNESNNKYSAISLLGHIANIEKDIPLARYYFNKVLDESKYEENITKLELARLERNAKNEDRALSLLKELDSNNSYVKLETAKCLVAKNIIDKASIIIDSIDCKNDIHLKREIRKLQAKIEYQFGCYEESEKIYEELKKEPVKDELYYNIILEQAKNALEQEKYQKALDYSKELVNCNYTYNNEIFILRGLAYQNLKEYDEALKSYYKALETDIVELRNQANYFLGTLLLFKGDLEEAKKYLKENYLFRGYDRGTCYKLAVIAIKQADFLEAKRYLDIIKANENNKKLDYSFRQKEIIVYKNLGLKPNFEPVLYSEKQLLNYSREEAINRIKLHNYDVAEESDRTPFAKNVEIESLMDEVPYLLDEKYNSNDSALNVYDIPYKNIGEYHNSKINNLRVVTEPFTDNIIAMYPTNETKIRPVDFHKHQIKYTDKPKVKKKRKVKLINFMNAII